MKQVAEKNIKFELESSASLALGSDLNATLELKCRQVYEELYRIKQ
jgi:hypothetical protein